MRKLIIALVAICVVVVLILAVVPMFLDVNRYHDRIQSELQQRLGRPVTLGNIKASFLPPSLKVQDVNIGEDPQFGPGPFARAQQLNIRVALLPLLRKDLQIQSLTLLSPDVEMIRAKNGEWNYSTLGNAPPSNPNIPPAKTPAPSKQQKKPSAGTTPEGGKPNTPQLSLGHLQIQNGRLHFTDQKNNFRATYDNIDVKLDHFEPGKPFDLDATVHIAGKGDQQIHVAGTAGPIGTGMPPFDGSVDLKQVSIADLRNVSQISSLNGYNGVLSGSMKAKTNGSNLSSEGTLKITDPELHGTTLGYPISLDYKLSDDTNSDVINIDHGVLHLGPTPITIAGTINSKATPAQLDVHVTADNASIAEMARLAAAAGVAFNAGSQMKGQLSADITAKGASSTPSLNGTLRAAGVEVSGGQVKEPVRIPQVELALTPAAVNSNQFQAMTGGTTLNLQVGLQNYTTPSPLVNAKVQTSNANIGELLSIARAYGVSAVEGFDGSGQLTLNVTASGPLKNTSALVFNGNGEVQNAALRTPSLAKPLNVRNANLRFSQNSMMLDNLNASLDQTNATGNMSVRNFAAPQVQFTLNADKVDLAAIQQIVGTPPPQQQQQQKRASLDLIPRAEAAPAQPPSLLTKATGGGNISIGQLTYEQLVLQDVKAQVVLDHGVIRLQPLTSTLYGGQQSGSIVIDTRVTPPAVSVSSKLQRVDANKLISSTTSLKETIYGLLAANANTNFRASSAEEVTRTLSGTLNLDLSNGRIAHIDMLNQLANIGRFLNASAAPQPQQPFTAVTKLSGDFNVVNGLAQTNNLRLVIPGANLAAQGNVNLATNALDLHVTAVLSKDLSQKAGGTGVGGFMQTALANKNGELVMPVLITGTFDHPMFAPDVQQVAQMKLQNLLPSFNNPGNLSSGILGAVLGGKNQNQGQGGLNGVLGALSGQNQKQGQQNQNQNQAQDQQQQDQNPLDGLLNGVLQGKKKKNQQQPQQ
ncbi:MAG: hypothetical protein C5B46_02960 [Proteobacteria bacterium]|nr:MAG: hypothetical protein C5B46_02960 [Pseudomonadota bacterium]